MGKFGHLSVIYLLLFLSFPYYGISQDNKPFNIDFSAYRSAGANRKKNENFFKKMLNNEFSTLVSGQSKTSLGNFASVDLTSPSVSFAGSSISRNGSVLVFKAAGTATDGLVAVFKNSRLNTQVNLDIQYNFLSLGNQSFSYNADSADVYNEGVEKLAYDYASKRTAILLKKDSIQLLLRKQKTAGEAKKIQDRLDTLPPSLVKDSLMFELAEKNQLADSLDGALRNYPGMLTLLHTLHDQTVQKLDKLSFSNAIEEFSFGWFSMGYHVNNNSFSLLIPANIFNQQVTKTSFVSHEATLQYAFYNYRHAAFKTYYTDIGGVFSYADNFSTLAKTSISEITEYGTSSGQRNSTKTYTAYQGNYQKGLLGLSLYGDLYYFLFKNNLAALHLGPGWDIQKTEKPVGNLFTGFLVAFKSAKGDNSIVNAELYYQFLDIFHTTSAEYRLFERNNIGIKFSFPIQFKYN